MTFRWLWHRRRELDERVEDANRRADDARKEAELSRHRQKMVEENVVAPLRRAATHNQFAEMLRRSLVQGHGNRS